jgi:hypothetical protein
MRVTGFNAMLGQLYEFIGRAPASDTEDTGVNKAVGTAQQRAEDRARPPKSGDNA